MISSTTASNFAFSDLVDDVGVVFARHRLVRRNDDDV